MNELTILMDKILARSLKSLRGRASMPRLVNGDYSALAARKGTTIDIPIPTAVETEDVVASHLQQAPTDTGLDMVQLTLNKWRHNKPIYLTDIEMEKVDAQGTFLPMQIEEAIKTLVGDINTSVLETYVDDDMGVYGIVGSAGVTPFSSVATATQARKVLQQQQAPRTDRRGVLDFEAEAAALELPAFSDAEKIMSADVKLEGEIGRKFGIDWVAEDDIITHTAGTINATVGTTGRKALVNNVAGYAAGLDIVDVDNGTVAGTIVRGDIVSFSGHAQTYCVVSNTSSAMFNDTTKSYTFATNEIDGLKLYPALVAPIVDGEVMTVVATHKVNLVFHRDAFALAIRTLGDSTRLANLIGGTQMRTLTDPQTVIPLLMEVVRQRKQFAWDIDALWGAKLVRPQFAVRILG